MSDLVLVEELGPRAAQITLNRPEKRNAMNRAARGALLGALDRLRDTGTSVILLTGTGTAFCAGVDLKERGNELDGGQPGRRAGLPTDERTSWNNVQEALRVHPAIVIAAVNGYALGGGVTLINNCDLAIASDDALIGMPELGLGVYPGLAGPATQLRILRKHAAWMILTTERITGKQAEDWGLVNRSVPAGELMDTARELTRRVASFDPVTLAWTKKALWEIPMHISDWSSALEFGQYVSSEIRSKREGAQDGVIAFAKGS